MGDITRRIGLFNQAYSRAWAEITVMPGVVAESTAVSLAAFIRLQITAGENDPETIAMEAIKALKA